MKDTYTREEVLSLMKQAWWQGHDTSRYVPNLSGSCNSDIKKLITPEDEDED